MTFIAIRYKGWIGTREEAPWKINGAANVRRMSIERHSVIRR